MFDYMINMPVKILFGAGKRKDLGTSASKLGKKAFFLYDPYLKGSQMLNDIKSDLVENGIDFVEFNNVEPNPRNTTIDNAADLCVAEKCDIVIAMGGGSAIDSAKAVAIVAKNGGRTWDYTRRTTGDIASPKKGKLPIIVIPTTSGTGTEATPFAVINNPSLHFKATIVEDECFATIAILDPEVTASMPPMLTALTGIDAFAHALEAYGSSLSNQFNDVLCLEAMRLFIENIKECCRNGNNIEARANITLASLLGGMVIGHACTAMPHAIAQAFGGITDAPHGAAIATCTKAVLKWTLPHGEKKYAKVGEMIDPSIANLSDAQKASKLPDLVNNLFVEILNGKSVNMRAYGLSESQIEDVADLVMNCYYGDCELQPRVPSREDIIEVIKMSF